MPNKKTIKSILGVTISNGIAIISGVIVGFILPKILSMDDYGWYKTFTLYTTYIGLFCLGIPDGIILKYGNYDYDELNKPKFRSYFRAIWLMHILFAVAMVCIGLFLLDGERKFILVLLAFHMLITNCTGYFQQISQITQRFKEFSARKILQSVFTIISVLIVFLIYAKYEFATYRMYVVFTVAFGALLLAWYIYTYRGIVFGVHQSRAETKVELIDLIKIGFPLLFANLCASFILTLDRQFVNVLFDNETYAVYAFAYNMLSLVTVATSAISTVLYPTMKRQPVKRLVDLYPVFICIMLAFIFFSMIVYFPLIIFVNNFLPKYSGSLEIFRVIFPGLAISSCVTVIMHNYYKVFGDNNIYFKKSFVIVIISGIANAIAYITFKSTISISVASIITMLLWYIYVEHYLTMKNGAKYWKNLVYMIAMSTAFYIVTVIQNIMISCVAYVVCFIIITLMFEKKEISIAMNLLRK